MIGAEAAVPRLRDRSAGALSAGIKGVMDLGEAVRLRRTELGMSQAALAEAAGVDTWQIRRYEVGEQQPPFTVAVGIAAALRVPLAELPGLSTEPATRWARRCCGPARPGSARVAFGSSDNTTRRLSLASAASMGPTRRIAAF